jgi:hypothetical protein
MMTALLMADPVMQAQVGTDGRVARGDARAQQEEGDAASRSPRATTSASGAQLPSDVPDALLETVPQAMQLLDEGMSSCNVTGEVVDVAVSVLADYESQGACVLAWEGYLDLTGNVWASLVQGDGWVEMKVVSQATSTQSQIMTIRMDADAWEEELKDSGVGRDDA